MSDSIHLDTDFTDLRNLFSTDHSSKIRVINSLKDGWTDALCVIPDSNTTYCRILCLV